MTTEEFAPYSEESERAVIGALLVAGTFGPTDEIDEIKGILTPAMFFNQRLRVCYESAMQIYDSAESLNVVRMAHELQKRGQWDQVNGKAFLRELMNDCPTSVLLPRYASVVIECFDRRTALKAYRKAVERVSGWEDMDTVESETSEAVRPSARVDPADKPDIRSAVDAWLEENMSDSQTLPIPTLIPHLDEMLSGGLHVEQLVILGGYPGSGKTATAIQVAQETAVQKHGVLYLSYEMSANELVTRMVAARTRINVSAVDGVVRNQSSELDRVMEATGYISELPLRIPSDAVGTVENIVAQSRQAANAFARSGGAPLRLIVVDHLHLIQGDNPKLSRNNELDIITQRLKALARELNVTVLALSQLNRPPAQSRNSKPDLSSLRDSGTIEQNADAVIMVHTPKSDENDTNKAEKITYVVRKNRRGPLGDAGALFDKRYQLIKGARDIDDWPEFKE